jgi:hypothetical protein
MWMQKFYSAVEPMFEQLGAGAPAAAAAAAVAAAKSQAPRQKHVSGRKLQQTFNPQELANLVWGLGRLHSCPPKPWINQLLGAVEANLAQFSPQQLSNVLWGLANLRSNSRRPAHSSSSSSSSSTGSSSGSGQGGASVVISDALLLQLSEAAETLLQHYSPQELSCVVWGLAELQRHSAAACAAEEASSSPPVRSLLLFMEACCWQMATAAAAAAGPASRSTGAAAVDQQHSSTVKGAFRKVQSAQFSKVQKQQQQNHHHHLHPQQRQQHRLQQQQQHHHRSQVDPSAPGRAGKLCRGLVQPLHVARVLKAYQTCAKLQQQQQQQRQQQQQQLHSSMQELPQLQGMVRGTTVPEVKLPQPVLQKLALLLVGSAGSSKNVGSSSSSTSSSIHCKTLRPVEVAGFCQALLLLVQIGFSPSPAYITAALELLHDQLHLLTGKDFETVAKILRVLGYVPSKPWVSSYLAAARERFDQMSPEGLLGLLLCAWRSEQWFYMRSCQQQQQQQHWPGTGSSDSNSQTSGSHMSTPGKYTAHQLHRKQGKTVAADAATAAAAAAAAAAQLAPSAAATAARCGEAPDSTGCLVVDESWVSQLISVMRAKVRCRQAAAHSLKPTLLSTAGGGPAGVRPGAVLLYDLAVLDHWLQQQQQQQQQQQLLVGGSTSHSAGDDSVAAAYVQPCMQKQQQQEVEEEEEEEDWDDVIDRRAPRLSSKAAAAAAAAVLA